MKEYPYQWRVLFLMTLAWGFSGLAHNSVAFLFPYFSQEFSLSNTHNGYLTADLALFWTLAIIVCGRKADEIGHVKIMVPGLLLGATALALLALVSNVGLLYMLIAIVGFGCGSMCSPSFSFLAEQSDPKKRGLFYGIAMSSFSLIGSAMGSLIFTRIGDGRWGWRGCYLAMAILVAFVAILIFVLGRSIPRKKEDIMEEKHNFKEILVYKNVILSTVLACFLMMWYFGVASFAILYLMETKTMTAVVAGAIFAGFGSGGFLGEFFTPIISDRVGRKKTALIATLIGAICFAIFLFVHLSNGLLCVMLAISSMCISGAMAILNSVVPSESVPSDLVATATSFTPAAGEFVGGVIAPFLVGVLISCIGISRVIPILIVLPILVIVCLKFLKETAPSVLKKC